MSIILHKMPSKPYKLPNASLPSESQLSFPHFFFTLTIFQVFELKIIFFRMNQFKTCLGGLNHKVLHYTHKKRLTHGESLRRSFSKIRNVRKGYSNVYANIYKFTIQELSVGQKLILGLFQVDSSIMRLKSCIYINYLLNAQGKK